MLEIPLGTFRGAGPTKSIKHQDAATTSSREGPACKLQGTGCILCIYPGFARFPEVFASDVILSPEV